MAYFECTIGGASGDGVALIVECSADFAGSVITADNGVDSFSETCPSVSPYTVKFEGIPIGTYTISGVSQGQTFTTQFTVLDYQTTLNAIPNGATVTPTDDIQTWLHCANIWDKNYSTISQVLADTTTLLALVSSNNAADYMARSTTWASDVCSDITAMGYIGNNDYCANVLLADSTWSNAICNSSYFESVLNVKVPTMTSNTTPYGVVSASGELGGYPAYYAFDGNDSSSWRSSSPTSAQTGEAWIDYKFPNKTLVKQMFVSINDGTPRAWTYTVQYSTDNGATYTDFETESASAVVRFTKDLAMTTACTNIRLKLNSRNCRTGSGTYLHLITTLQFYGREQS